jgi:protease-4
MEDRTTVTFEGDGQSTPGSYGRGSRQGGGSGKNRGLVRVIILIIILAAAVVAVAALFHGGLGTKGGSMGRYIAVLDIDGEITDEPTTSLISGTSSYDQQWLLDKISELENDSGNCGIMITMNTPGGSSYASDEMYSRLKKYRKKTGRPVYVYMKSEAASGGYYIAAAADRIYANRNTWTGSIGVRLTTIYDVSGLLDKMGVKTVTIASGKNKAMGDPTQELTSEQKKLLQDLVDESYEQFLDVVAEGRGMKKSEFRHLADGRILSARQAKDAGLIDGICSESAAFRRMRRQEGLENVKFRYFENDTTSSGLLSSVASLLKGSQKSSSKYDKLMSLLENGNSTELEYMAPIKKK